jgi:hypothetical protein
MIFPPYKIIAHPYLRGKTFNVHVKTTAGYFRVIRQKPIGNPGDMKANRFQHRGFVQTYRPEF